MADDLYDKATEWAKAQSQNIDGSLAAPSQKIADSLHDIGLNQDTAEGIVPVAGALLAGGAALAMAEPINKVGTGISGFARKLVTGFGLFEEIPLIGGLFTMLGDGVESLGHLASIATAAIGGIAMFKALSAPEKEVAASGMSTSGALAVGAVPFAARSPKEIEETQAIKTRFEKELAETAGREKIPLTKKTQTALEELLGGGRRGKENFRQLNDVAKIDETRAKLIIERAKAEKSLIHSEIKAETSNFHPLRKLLDKIGMGKIREDTNTEWKDSRPELMEELTGNLRQLAEREATPATPPKIPAEPVKAAPGATQEFTLEKTTAEPVGKTLVVEGNTVRQASPAHSTPSEMNITRDPYGDGSVAGRLEPIATKVATPPPSPKSPPLLPQTELTLEPTKTLAVEMPSASSAGAAVAMNGFAIASGVPMMVSGNKQEQGTGAVLTTSGATGLAAQGIKRFAPVAESALPALEKTAQATGGVAGLAIAPLEYKTAEKEWNTAFDGKTKTPEAVYHGAKALGHDITAVGSATAGTGLLAGLFTAQGTALAATATAATTFGTIALATGGAVGVVAGGSYAGYQIYKINQTENAALAQLEQIAAPGMTRRFGEVETNPLNKPDIATYKQLSWAMNRLERNNRLREMETTKDIPNPEQLAKHLDEELTRAKNAKQATLSSYSEGVSPDYADQSWIVGQKRQVGMGDGLTSEEQSKKVKLLDRLTNYEDDIHRLESAKKELSEGDKSYEKMYARYQNNLSQLEANSHALQQEIAEKTAYLTKRKEALAQANILNSADPAELAKPQAALGQKAANAEAFKKAAAEHPDDKLLANAALVSEKDLLVAVDGYLTLAAQSAAKKQSAVPISDNISNHFALPNKLQEQTKNSLS